MEAALKKTKKKRKKSSDIVVGGVLLGVSLLFCCGVEALEDSPLYYKSPPQLFMILGRAQTIPVDVPTRVAVGNPTVVDIAQVNEKDIVLLPRNRGQTTLIVWDKNGQRDFLVKVLGEDLNELKARIELLLQQLDISGIQAKINEAEGKVALIGRLRTPEQKKRLDDFLAPFAQDTLNMVELETRPLMVQMDVWVLELSKTALDKLGFDWMDSLIIREAPYSTTKGAVTLNKQFAFDRKTDTIGTNPFVLYERDALAVTINTLIKKGNGRELSRPKLVCLSGKEAELLVGGEVPVVTTTTFTTGAATQVNVDYKQYGVNMKIKPEVQDDGTVKTSMKIEITEVDPVNSVISGSISIPAFTKRLVQSDLHMGEKQTALIAGLLKNKEATNVQKFPALGDVPILGALFRSKEFELGDSELVITLTPHVIYPGLNEGPLGSGLGRENEPLPGQDPVRAYIGLIQNRIYQASAYPQEARKRKLEGTVKLTLHLLSDGRLESVVVSQTSGYKVLDDAAVAAAQRIAPYQAFSKYMNLKELWVDIPIVYRFKNEKE